MKKVLLIALLALSASCAKEETQECFEVWRRDIPQDSGETIVEVVYECYYN